MSVPVSVGSLEGRGLRGRGHTAPAPMATVISIGVGMVIGICTCMCVCGFAQGAWAANSTKLTLAALNDQQARLSSTPLPATADGRYVRAGAQAWLDIAFDEFYESDRSEWTSSALLRSSTLLARVAPGSPTAPASLPETLPAGVPKVRPDLWAVAEAVKAGPGLFRFADIVASLEVTLAEAGHEYEELGWRHARGSILAAEALADRLKLAPRGLPVRFAPPSPTIQTPTLALAPSDERTAAVPPSAPAGPAGSTSQTAMAPAAVSDPSSPVAGCTPRDADAAPAWLRAPVLPDELPSATAAPTATQPGASAALAVAANPALPGQVHFGLNQWTVSPASAVLLDKVAAYMKRNPTLTVVAVGDADGEGLPDDQLLLSRRRAEAVRLYLVLAGVNMDRVGVDGAGGSRPVLAATGQADPARSRRVELFYYPASAGVTACLGEDDMQP